MAQSPPLAGVKVVEHADGLAGAYAGFLLRELGAEVVRLESWRAVRSAARASCIAASGRWTWRRRPRASMR